MNNRIINLIKLRQNIDNNSIEYFHACLKYNAKLQPIVKEELVKWPIYEEYWDYLVKHNHIHPFKIKTSIDKITISGDYIRSPLTNQNNKTTVFLLHGITNTRFWIFKQAYTFLKAGFNVVWYDARNHGMSDAAATTFGKKESRDLQDVLNFINKEYPKIENFILYGFSLGAASILMWGKLYSKYAVNKKVKLIISDSCFSRIDKTYDEKVHNHIYLPTKYMVHLLRNQAKRNLGTENLSVLRPINYLKFLGKIPCIFLHGIGDRFVTYVNSEELYQEKIRHEQPIKSQLYLIDKAIHGQSFLVGDNNVEIFDEYNQEYNEKLSNLILDYIKMNID